MEPDAPPAVVPVTVFGRLAATVLHNRRRSFAAIFVVFLAALALVTSLRVDSDLLSLLPPDEPTIRSLVELEERGQALNLVVVTVDGAPEATSAFLGELRDRLEASDDVAYVVHDLEPDLAWRIGLMQLDRDELGSIRDRLKGAIALGPAAANPFVSARLLDLGPMTAKLQGAKPESSLLTSGGLARLLIRPSTKPQDIGFARRVMGEIDGAIAELDPGARGVRLVWIGGPYRHNVEDYEGVVHDIRWTGVGAFLLIFTFLSIGFRDPRVLLLIFTPLVVATTVAFGFAAVAVGELNTFTGFFGAVLLGLGIDFSIHLYSRYREERPGAPSLEHAVVQAWDRVGPPCLAAALTTAGGFTALMAARFRGFSELGLLLAIGVLICLACVLTILPLLIAWRESRPVPHRVRRWRRPGFAPPPTYRFAPVVLLLLSMVTGLGLFSLPRVEFEYDLSELRRDGLAYEDLDDEQREQVRDSYAPLVMSLPSLEALSTAHDHYSERIATGDLEAVSRVLSLRTLVPADQDVRLGVLEEIVALTQDEDFRFLPPTVQQNLSRLAATPLRPLTAEDLPLGLRDVLGATGGNYRMLLIPSGNMWDLREAASLLDIADTQFTEGPVAGQHLAVGRLYTMVRRDAPLITLLALLLVSIGTLSDLRRFRQALGAVAVLLSGMLWAGAAIALFRVKLSIVNVVGIPILLGIGVDVVIHLLHRLREEGPGRVLVALSTTGWAALLSAITTVLSFAALSLASSQAIRSLGTLVLVGLTAVTLAAFALLPVGWMTAWKLSGEDPDEG